MFLKSTCLNAQDLSKIEKAFSSHWIFFFLIFQSGQQVFKIHTDISGILLFFQFNLTKHVI